MRRRRFRTVASVMHHLLHLDDNDIVVDLGAGHCQFDYHLRVEWRWRGVYVPVDGSIDGTDLNHWAPDSNPQTRPAFYVALEILEHLDSPMALVDILKPTKGVVLTTPNPKVVDVLGCDEDHITPVSKEQLQLAGFTVREIGFFGTPKDTLLAWRRA